MGYQRSNGVEVGDIFEVTEHDMRNYRICTRDTDRVKEGDLLLAQRHTGDCFFYYLLLSRQEEQYWVYDTNSIGSYTLSLLYERQPTPAELQKLLAGERTVLNRKLDVSQAQEERRQKAAEEMGGIMDRAIASVARAQGR